MAGSKFALAASTLLVASAAVASAQECSADVSESFIATVDNSTYFNTCAEGTTFNVSSVFDVLNFTDSEFLAFCNSSTCLEPLHELMDSVDCLITYQGSARNLSEEVDELHDQCHEVLEEAEGGHAHHSMAMSMSGMDMGGHSHTHSSGSTASGSSGASSAVLAAGSVVSAAIAAVLLA
ncbi:elicitin [Phytophthora sojae]|uniref:Elicitin n=2 Tax=Phytophthora sojae TaxID=67593 RepID=G4YKS8_PHYSP|nr:elicitin [Phytophthora sojae]ABB56004.1 elicitin-like protein SOL11B [Phytophthora sojae]EGZ29232.1 elicitin [Phytophthora sojae]|eukprot:XP_009516507.1 elicitin [Phytophthora sojae]